MPNKHPRMRLSREEEVFLRHWMYDETHYQEGPGPAKQLQLRHRAIPADLAAIIAAAFPDLSEQEGLREFYRRAHALKLIPRVPELRFHGDS